MAPNSPVSSDPMTAHHSHHGLEKPGIGKLTRHAREHLHWLAILLWGIALLMAIAPLL